MHFINISGHILPYLNRMKKQFRVLLITGSRQIGKSTLLKEKFLTDYKYVTLDDSKNTVSYSINDDYGTLKVAENTPDYEK